jgi:hypothetical protein
VGIAVSGCRVVSAGVVEIWRVRTRGVRIGLASVLVSWRLALLAAELEAG